MPQQNNKDLVLHVRVSAASKMVWEGDAYSVTSENSDGRFDILGLHSNFLTLIREKPIKIEHTDGTTSEYTFKESVILVTENQVKIFADITG